MPRPKVVERRRCVKACSNCKSRKEKCEGIQPCAQCRKRNIEDQCDFSTRPVTKPTSFEFQSAQIGHPDLGINGSNASSSSEKKLESSTTFNSLTEQSHRPSQASTTTAPVPKLSRMLRDTNGRFIYIGDSASLSFLQTIRRIVDSSIGPCGFTTDPLRHRLIEIPPDAVSPAQFPSEPFVDLEEALELTQHYFLVTSGALDLFEISAFFEKIAAWAADPDRAQRPDAPMFYLVLALGAQARLQATPDDARAGHYFSYGRSLARAYLMENPCTLTVQTFLMIAWYLLTACRRDAACVNLGIAVQAAYALGVHRHEANIAFKREEGISRERAWKTLRVCDLFLSASMGRPSTTSNIDCNIPRIPFMRSRSSDKVEPSDRASSAMARICLVFERILSEVYSKHAVSLELAGSISEEHRAWTAELPEMLKTDRLAKPNIHDPADLTQQLGSSIVVMAYFYSIILLTRPFLAFAVSSYLKIESQSREWAATSGGTPTVSTYADACVTSAIQGIAKAYEVVLSPGMPKRMPLVINSVFISALSLGLSFFGDYDLRGWPVQVGIAHAIEILKHFGAHSAQSARYQTIIELLWECVRQYKAQRDGTMLRLRSAYLDDIFGKVSDEPDSSSTNESRLRQTEALLPFSIATSPGPSQQDNPARPNVGDLQNFESLLESSMITTSGMLAPHPSDDVGFPYWQHFNGIANPDAFFNDMPTPGSSTFSLRDEVPLFAVMNTYFPED